MYATEIEGGHIEMNGGFQVCESLAESKTQACGVSRNQQHELRASPGPRHGRVWTCCRQVKCPRIQFLGSGPHLGSVRPYKSKKGTVGSRALWLSTGGSGFGVCRHTDRSACSIS